MRSVGVETGRCPRRARARDEDSEGGWRRKTNPPKHDIMRIVSVSHYERDIMSHTLSVTRHAFSVTRVSVVVRRKTTTFTRRVLEDSWRAPRPANVRRTTTLTRRVLEDSRRPPRRRRRRSAARGPAAVGLGDSWKRGTDNPHDLIFWRIQKDAGTRAHPHTHRARTHAHSPP